MLTVKRFLLGILTIFLGACSMFQRPATPQPTPLPATPTLAVPTPVVPTPLPDAPGISPEDVRNSEYQLGFSDQIRTVQLTDGKYQENSADGTGYLSVSVTDFIARGDLNGDGENEAVAIVAEDYGGSGTFVFLAVYQYLNDKAVFLTSIFLDDRPRINHLAVEKGEIFVDIVIHGKDDPMCCPTLATTRKYLLNGVNLILTNYTTETPAGQPREITIDAPVEGAQVSGIIRLLGNITIAPFENNLVYRVYDLGGVELSAGPVNVEATDLGAPGRFEKAIDLGNIITNTTVRIEVQDINVADGSLFAMDSVMLIVR
ncbi:MAG: Gmad2 immunoglobulin-like domain-containing protein [Anaerolineales bacterium]